MDASRDCGQPLSTRLKLARQRDRPARHVPARGAKLIIRENQRIGFAGESWLGRGRLWKLPLPSAGARWRPARKSTAIP